LAIALLYYGTTATLNKADRIVRIIEAFYKNPEKLSSIAKKVLQRLGKSLAMKARYF
jgi:hypothetical protein